MRSSFPHFPTAFNFSLPFLFPPRRAPTIIYRKIHAFMICSAALSTNCWRAVNSRYLKLRLIIFCLRIFRPLNQKNFLPKNQFQWTLIAFIRRIEMLTLKKKNPSIRNTVIVLQNLETPSYFRQAFLDKSFMFQHDVWKIEENLPALLWIIHQRGEKNKEIFYCLFWIHKPCQEKCAWFRSNFDF